MHIQIFTYEIDDIGMGFKIRWVRGVGQGISEKRLAMSWSLVKLSDVNLRVCYTIFLIFVFV